MSNDNPERMLKGFVRGACHGTLRLDLNPDVFDEINALNPEERSKVITDALREMMAEELANENYYHAVIRDFDGALYCYEDGCRFYQGCHDDYGEGRCKLAECPYPDGPRIDIVEN